MALHRVHRYEASQSLVVNGTCLARTDRQIAPPLGPASIPIHQLPISTLPKHLSMKDSPLDDLPGPHAASDRANLASGQSPLVHARAESRGHGGSRAGAGR
jgi:hypothetical protein